MNSFRREWIIVKRNCLFLIPYVIKTSPEITINVAYELLNDLMFYINTTLMYVQLFAIIISLMYHQRLRCNQNLDDLCMNY